MIGRSAAVLFLLATYAIRSDAQITRSGLAATVGIASVASTCSDCDGSESGAGMFYRIGGFVSNQLAITLDLSDFKKNLGDGIKQDDGYFVVAASYYPSNTSNFFLSGGIGRGRSTVDDGYDYVEITGMAYSVGAGIDLGFRGNDKSGIEYFFTPFIKYYSTTGGRIDFSGSKDTGVNASLLQIGIGLTSR